MTERSTGTFTSGNLVKKCSRAWQLKSLRGLIRLGVLVFALSSCAVDNSAQVPATDFPPSASLSRSTPAPETALGERVALVIGNAAYQNGALRNPVNDATDVSSKLSSLGFTVIEGKNLDRDAMVRKVQEFRENLGSGGVALLYYSGHGIEIDGLNYLVPVNNSAIRTVQDVEIYGLDVHRIVSQMEASGAHLNVVILDACRDNPLPSVVRSSSKGLTPMDAARGTIIAFATRKGQVAADGYGRNSPYTAALLKFLGESGLAISQMFNRIGLEVSNTTGGVQVPWVSSSPVPELMLAGGGNVSPYVPPVSQPVPSVPPAPRSSSIHIKTKGKFIDNSRAGAIVGFSFVTIRIPSIGFEYDYWLDESWEDQSLTLPHGRHEFEVDPSIEVRSGTIENTCRGFIDVRGPASFRFSIKLDRTSLSECELKPER